MSRPLAASIGRYAGSLVAVLLTFAALAVPAEASGTVIRVAPGGADTASCGTEAQPCATLQHAVNRTMVTINGRQRVSGEVRVAGGTYTRPDAGSVVTIIPGTMTLRGGYSTSNWSVSDPAANPTTIDGQAFHRGIAVVGDLSLGIAACAITIEGVTIRNGVTPSDDPAGGGVLADNCNVVLRSVTVSQNVARGQNNQSAGAQSAGVGGGVAVRGPSTSNPASAAFYNVTIDGNRAEGGSDAAVRGGLASGGGLFVINATVYADGLTVANNVAKAGNAPGTPGESGGQRADGLGGGVFLVFTPSFVLNNLDVRDNRAEGGVGGKGGLGLGGGIKVELSSGRISSSSVFSNEALGATATGGVAGAGLGGGIFSTDSALTLDAVTVVANDARGAAGSGGDGGGGGIYLTIGSTSSSTLNASNVVIAENRASTAGSGIVLGGGLECASAQMNLANATFSGNRVENGTTAGPAIAIVGFGAGQQCSGSVGNSIIANHGTALAPVDANSFAGTVAFSRTMWWNNGGRRISNPFGRPVSESNGFDGDPLFISPGAPNYNYHISAGSAARDAAQGSVPATDLDGQTRPEGQAADVGADEYSTQVLATALARIGGVELRWKGLPGFPVTGYRIEYTKEGGAADASQGASPIDVPGTALGTTLTGLTPGRQYSYTIIALNNGVEVGRSATLTPGTRFSLLPVVLR